MKPIRSSQLGWAWLILLLLPVLSCSPVKKVLNNPKHFDKVAQEVVRRGYCVNDTILVDTSEITVVVNVVDSLVHDTVRISSRSLDTVLKNGTRIILDSADLLTVHYPAARTTSTTRTFSTEKILVDRKLEQILRSDIAGRDSIIAKRDKQIEVLSQGIREEQSQVRELKSKVKLANYRLALVLIIIGVFYGFKLYRKFFL